MRASRLLVLLWLWRTQAQTTTVAPGCAGIFVYQDCSYGGLRAQLPVGRFTTEDLYSNHAWNNAISSAQIPFGCVLTVYDQDHFLGNSRNFTSSDSCFVNEGWNDKISSVVVSVGYFSNAPTKAPTVQPPETCQGGTGGNEQLLCRSGRCKYQDHGAKNCNGICGHPIRFTYRHARGPQCRADCSSFRNCTGYSVSTSSNCMLWHETIGALGNSWGGSHCMVKMCEGQTTVPPQGTCNPTRSPTKSPTGPTHAPTKRPTRKPVKHVDDRGFVRLYGYWSWTDAQNHCRARGKGWDLASVLNDQDLVALHQVAGSQTCWIGLNDIISPGRWAWSDRSPFKYTHWNPGEPNNAHGTEHCVEMTAGNGWNDLTCSSRLSACCGYRSASAANADNANQSGMRAGVIVLIVIGALIAVCVLGRFVLFENKQDAYGYQAQSNYGDNVNVNMSANSHLIDSTL